MTFADHFSRVSASYAQFRPHYPDALFHWIAATADGHARAWDCATGNGQAAIGLADRFAEVIATDASAEQIAHATPHPRVDYRVAPAEASGLAACSVDVVTAAQALHWLPRERFFDEARRVLRAGAPIVVWGYHVPLVHDATIDAAIDHYIHTVVGPFWPPERALVMDRFASITFPFAEIASPPFAIRVPWTLDAFSRYLGTQSATDRYRMAHDGADPVPAFVASVAERWGGVSCVREVEFPLFVRAGRT